MFNSIQGVPSRTPYLDAMRAEVIKMAGFGGYNPYLDKTAAGPLTYFWKGLKRPFKEFGTNLHRQEHQVQHLFRHPFRHRLHNLRFMLNYEAANRVAKANRGLYKSPHRDMSKAIYEAIVQKNRGLEAMLGKATANTTNTPSYLQALKQAYSAGPAVYKAGMLAVPAGIGAAGLTGAVNLATKDKGLFN